MTDSQPLRVLVGCETSGRVREAFRARGVDAWSCDLLPALDSSPYHIQADVLTVLADGWDVGIFFPTCTYLCSSGLHWNTRRPERAALTEQAVAFVEQLRAAPIPRKAFENPIGCLSTRWRKPDQIIQPWQFGDDASKATCLWLETLPPLDIVPALAHPGRVVEWNGKQVRRWSNQTDSGQNRLPPSADRWAKRSQTYPGIANAMAATWSTL